MSLESRPVSPHLQVYRWQVSNSLSILHRLTGLALSLGALALVGWLLALASGQTAFAQVSWAFGSFPLQVLLIGWTFCFFFHLCNGVRHLAWDADYGFDKSVARRSGIGVIVVTVILTSLFWFVAMTGAGV
jgi:succinate dehydrogenase / fumarate reductase, cytochrome b subunit